MTKDEALEGLEGIKVAMRAQFDNVLHDARLQQLDAAIDTAAMAVGHLHDEDVNEANLRERIKADPSLFGVHGHQVRGSL